jgi:hypothetical protein
MGNLERVPTWGTQSTVQNTENTTQFRQLRRLAAPKKNAVNQVF